MEPSTAQEVVGMIWGLAGALVVAIGGVLVFYLPQVLKAYAERAIAEAREGRVRLVNTATSEAAVLFPGNKKAAVEYVQDKIPSTLAAGNVSEKSLVEQVTLKQLR